MFKLLMMVLMLVSISCKLILTSKLSKPSAFEQCASEQVVKFKLGLAAKVIPLRGVAKATPKTPSQTKNSCYNFITTADTNIDYASTDKLLIRISSVNDATSYWPCKKIDPTGETSNSQLVSGHQWYDMGEEAILPAI